MFRTKTLPITVAAGGKTLEAFVVSTPQVSRRVVAVIPVQTAGVNVVANVDNDAVHDTASDLFGATTDPRFRVDKLLKVGETFYAGYRDISVGIATYNITVEYEEIGS